MKTILELEQAIRDIICKIYCKLYIGKLEVVEIKNSGYMMRLYLNTDSQPICVAANLNKEDFLVFIEQQLRDMHLHHDHYYTGYKAEPYLTPCHERIEMHNNRGFDYDERTIQTERFNR